MLQAVMKSKGPSVIVIALAITVIHILIMIVIVIMIINLLVGWLGFCFCFCCFSISSISSVVIGVVNLLLQLRYSHVYSGQPVRLHAVRRCPAVPASRLCASCPLPSLPACRSPTRASGSCLILVIYLHPCYLPCPPPTPQVPYSGFGRVRPHWPPLLLSPFPPSRHAGPLLGLRAHVPCAAHHCSQPPAAGGVLHVHRTAQPQVTSMPTWVTLANVGHTWVTLADMGHT